MPKSHITCSGVSSIAKQRSAPSQAVTVEGGSSSTALIHLAPTHLIAITITLL